MKIGVPKEIAPGETRVALVPASIAALAKKKHEVVIESGAGLASSFTDEQYEKAGAVVVKTAEEVYASADIILKVAPPTKHPSGKLEAEMLKEGQVYVGYIAPFQNPETLKTMAARKVTVFAMEFIPRITRAQSMDSLSSQATLAGYKAVIIAADMLPKIFPLMMTAAGSIPPATVLILGAGVAGLQAIATAKRLGARVEAFDPRPVVKEQCESLGATFIPMETAADAQTAGGYAKDLGEDFLRREREAIAGRLPKADVVVTTALIFGGVPPTLITDDMIKLMQPGSVIVDLAAEQGGNTEGVKANETVEKHGVKIVGTINLPALLPINASNMYAKNLVNLFNNLYQKPELDFEEEVTKGACIARGGEIVNEMIKKRIAG